PGRLGSMCRSCVYLLHRVDFSVEGFGEDLFPFKVGVASVLRCFSVDFEANQFRTTDCNVVAWHFLILPVCERCVCVYLNYSTNAWSKQGLALFRNVFLVVCEALIFD